MYKFNVFRSYVLRICRNISNILSTPLISCQTRTSVIYSGGVTSLHITITVLTSSLLHAPSDWLGERFRSKSTFCSWGRGAVESRDASFLHLYCCQSHQAAQGLLLLLLLTLDHQSPANVIVISVPEDSYYHHLAFFTVIWTVIMDRQRYIYTCNDNLNGTRIGMSKNAFKA